MNRVLLDHIIQEISSRPNFSSLGFELTISERRPATELLGESYAVTFSNQDSRSIQIIYYPPSDGKDFFLVNIKNINTNSVFNLMDWLKQNEKHQAIATLNSINSTNTFNEKVKYLAAFLNDLLGNDDLNRVMRGHWEEVYFDWAGMK
jgi:hypothetical protein